MVPEAATLLFHNGARFPDFLSLGEGGVQLLTRCSVLMGRPDRCHSVPNPAGNIADAFRAHNGRNGKSLRNQIGQH